MPGPFDSQSAKDKFLADFAQGARESEGDIKQKFPEEPKQPQGISPEQKAQSDAAYAQVKQKMLDDEKAQRIKAAMLNQMANTGQAPAAPMPMPSAPVPAPSQQEMEQNLQDLRNKNKSPFQ